VFYLTKKFFKQRHILILLIFLGSANFLMTSCSRKSMQVSTPFDTPERFSLSGSEKMPDRWWTSFGDPVLNSMLDSALNSNFTLKSAWQQLLAARAVVDRESSFLLPDFDLTLQGGISRPQPDFVGGENMQLRLSTSYEIDLWGRLRANLEAQSYRADATFFDYRTTAISLSAEIVLVWYQLAASQYQLGIIEEQIETNQAILNLLSSRFGSGLIRGVDILRQKQLLEATRDQKVVTETRIQLLDHQLDVLLGRPPINDSVYPSDSLPIPPPLPETGIPIELVRRRPDVQSAHNLLQAADREVAAAINNKYPRLSISATTAIRSNDINDLFQEFARSFAGNLMTPLFFGGRLNAEVDRTEAVKNQRIYEYGQVVLIAFREVEDALIQETKQSERIEIVEEQLRLARQTYQQLQVQFFNGISDYLDVLTSLDQEQQLRRDLIAARLGLLENRIALYRALAGGFETANELNYDEDI